MYQKIGLLLLLGVFFARTCCAQDAAVEAYVGGEAGACGILEPGGGTRADRMRRNAVNHANTFCTGRGIKIGAAVSDFIAQPDGDNPPFCKVTGNIECNPVIVAPATAVMIDNCGIKNITDLGYVSGNMHAYCLNHGWNGGVIANATNGFCFKFPNGSSPKTACPRLSRYYNHESGQTCAHLTADDATKLHICGHP